MRPGGRTIAHGLEVAPDGEEQITRVHEQRVAVLCGVWQVRRTVEPRGVARVVNCVVMSDGCRVGSQTLAFRVPVQRRLAVPGAP